MSVVNDLGSLLVTAGLAEEGVALFYGMLPAEPDDGLAIVEYAGEAPAYIQETRLPNTESPRAQIVLRNKRYDTGRELIDEIYRAVHQSNVTINGTFYLRIRPLSSPFFLRRDENDRWEFVFNTISTKRI